MPNRREIWLFQGVNMDVVHFCGHDVRHCSLGKVGDEVDESISDKEELGAFSCHDGTVAGSIEKISPLHRKGQNN